MKDYEERVGRLLDAIRGQADVIVRQGALARSGDSTSYCPACWAENGERVALRSEHGTYACPRCRETWAAPTAHATVQQR